MRQKVFPGMQVFWHPSVFRPDHRPALTKTTFAENPGKRLARALGGIAIITTLVVGSSSMPAQAAGEILNVTLRQSTGTPGFDADDAPGHDSSADNEIVRTNDSVTYSVGVRFEGGDQTTPVISFSLPQGEELVSMPPFCLAGSSVTPATLPGPISPVTSTSWTALPTQSITCIVADQTQGTSLDYDFVAKVRPEVPDGTLLDDVVASAVSDQVTVPAESAPVSHSVSAAADFDLSKRLLSAAPNTGPLWAPNGICPWDSARACTLIEFPLTITAPAGGKGITPLASPITVTDDLSIDSFFGTGTTASAAWIAAGAGAMDKYAPRLVTCSSGPLNLWGSIPSPFGGGATVASAVRDSGTISCAQPTLGAPIEITFTDADTTAYTVPSRTASNAALSSDLGLVISTAIKIAVPLDATTDLGADVAGTRTLSWENSFSSITAADINGTPLVEDPSNNNRLGTTKLELSGSATKTFSGVTGAPGNTPIGTYSSWYEGPPGAGVAKDGNTVVVAGQTVLTNLIRNRQIPPASGEAFVETMLDCDVWDDTKLGMPVTFNFAGASATKVRYPSNGAPAWVSYFYYDGAIQPDASRLDNLTIEYGYTPTPGSGENSACDTSGGWASSPGDVSGATQANGVWQGVNQVRVSYNTAAAPTSQTFEVNLSVALETLASAGTVGTILPNYASFIHSSGAKDTASVISDTDRVRSLSSYVPGTNVGALGDRLILGEAKVRVRKFVRNPTSGAFEDTSVPQFTSGSTVDFRLNPSLTADAAVTGIEQDVMVEDCLPRHQSFVSSVRESGASIVPALVQQGSPAGSELSCPADQTYLKWDLGMNGINDVIDPIVYTVEISATARNGFFTNTVLVSSSADVSAPASRTDTAQIQLNIPTGISIGKTVDKQTIEVNPAGVTNARSFTYVVEFANVDSPVNVENVDVIDVLPANGVGGTSFAGTLALDSVTSMAPGLSIWHTNALPANMSIDPGAASNSMSGSTVWCDAAVGGAVVSGAGTAADCPSGLSEVTGLRFLRAGPFLPADEFRVAVAMTGFGNSAGDVYENRAGGRVDGVTQPVGPAARTVRVVDSSIGDLVWSDSNANGVQDAGELGIADFPVTLTGTDLDGNPVSANTLTDADGRYVFVGLASGNYTVTFDPEGLHSNQVFTEQNSGTNRTIDSDADIDTGQSEVLALGVAQDRTDIDAGVVQGDSPSMPAENGGLAFTGGGNAAAFWIALLLLIGGVAVTFVSLHRSRTRKQ